MAFCKHDSISIHSATLSMIFYSDYCEVESSIESLNDLIDEAISEEYDFAPKDLEFYSTF